MKFIFFYFYKTALHIAVDKESKDIVQILLTYPEIDVNIKTIPPNPYLYSFQLN